MLSALLGAHDDVINLAATLAPRTLRVKVQGLGFRGLRPRVP